MERRSQSRWLGPTAWMTAARLVRMTSGVALFGALARTLPVEDFGRWMLALGTWGLVETVREGASSSAYLRWMGVSSANERPRVTAALVVLATAWSAGSVVLLLPLAVAWPHGMLGTLLLGFTLLGPFATASGVVHVVLQARGGFSTLFAQRLAQGLGLGGAAAAILLGASEPVALALGGMAIGHVLSILVSMPALRHVPWRFQRLRPVVAQLFQHGRYAATSRAGSALHRSLDLWLVAALAGPEALALYAVAWKLADYAEILLQPFVKVLVPEISRRGRAPEEAVRLAARSTLMLTLVIGLVSVPLAGWPTRCIEMLAGPGYDGAARVLQVLVLFNLFRPLDRCAGVYLDAIGLPDANARKVFVALAVNGIGTVWALWFGGAVALELAALVSVVASGVGAAVAERSMQQRGVPGLLAWLRPAGRMLPGGTHGR